MMLALMDHQAENDQAQRQEEAERFERREAKRHEEEAERMERPERLRREDDAEITGETRN